MRGLQLLVLASLCIIHANSSPVNEIRLIKTSEKEPAKWLNLDEIWSLIGAKVNFVDITDHKFPVIDPNDVNIKAIPTQVRFQSTVTPLLPTLSVLRMADFVRTFSSYHNRYYTATTGIESQQWLLSQVRASVVGYPGDVSVTEFRHTWAQSSVIARIEGSDSALRGEIVVIGAHQDSINAGGSTLNAPGADDNASGSVVVLEVLRVLVNAGFIPKRTIEFHWYAAEEVGLRGSAAIAQSYYNSGVNVVSMMNLDVVGYHVAGNSVVGIYTDFTNAALNQFLRLVANAYVTFPWRDTRCGYGCSDHASWNSYGFPAAMPSEYDWHPQMHRVGDNLASVNFDLVNEFAKLALGYVVEMSEPSA